MNFYKYISILLGFPKSLYINLKYFKFRDAIKLPIIVSHKVLLRKISGKVNIDSKIKTGIIQIGFMGAGTFDERKQRTILELNGQVIFDGKFKLDAGAKISVINGELKFGKDVHIGCNSTIICAKRITFGDQCMVSWDNLIIDTDFHNIEDSLGNITNNDKEIIIGDNVWIGYRCTISKGSQISNGVIVASNTHVHTKIFENNIIIGGNPIRVLKENIQWSV